MGRRGGQKAAERWKNDPHGKYAQRQREILEKAISEENNKVKHGGFGLQRGSLRGCS